MTQQIFHTNKWWKGVLSNYAYRLYQNLTSKGYKILQEVIFYLFQIQSLKCLLLQNKKPFTQAQNCSPRKRACQCACNHCHTLLWATVLDCLHVHACHRKSSFPKKNNSKHDVINLSDPPPPRLQGHLILGLCFLLMFSQLISISPTQSLQRALA